MIGTIRALLGHVERNPPVAPHVVCSGKSGGQGILPQRSVNADPWLTDKVRTNNKVAALKNIFLFTSLDESKLFNDEFYIRFALFIVDRTNQKSKSLIRKVIRICKLTQKLDWWQIIANS